GGWRDYRRWRAVKRARGAYNSDWPTSTNRAAASHWHQPEGPYQRRGAPRTLAARAHRGNPPLASSSPLCLLCDELSASSPGTQEYHFAAGGDQCGYAGGADYSGCHWLYH